MPATPSRMAETLRMAEYAGRNCYRSHDKMTEDSHEKFLKTLIKNGHDSPLEFADMMVEIVTGRDVLAEITRHRLANFAVQSQRYVLDDKSGDISFIRPNFWTDDIVDAKNYVPSLVWQRAMADAEKYYKDLIHECGMKPEDARKVLPNSTACIIVMRANLREWRHIIDLRSSVRAYPEMRTMIDLLVEQMKELYPSFVYEDVYHGETNKDGE